MIALSNQDARKLMGVLEHIRDSPATDIKSRNVQRLAGLMAKKIKKKLYGMDKTAHKNQRVEMVE